jgi:hypothetical protein
MAPEPPPGLRANVEAEKARRAADDARRVREAEAQARAAEQARLAAQRAMEAVRPATDAFLAAMAGRRNPGTRRIIVRSGGLLDKRKSGWVVREYEFGDGTAESQRPGWFLTRDGRWYEHRSYQSKPGHTAHVVTGPLAPSETAEVERGLAALLVEHGVAI